MSGLIFSLFLLFSIKSYANTNREIKDFYKCYAKFMDDFPTKEHPLVQRIISQKVSGKEACISLFRDIHVNDSHLFSPMTSENKKVISTLQKFYNSWIKMKNLNLETQDFVNTDYYDLNESAYPLIYSLFSDRHYKNIFKGNQYYRAIRKSSHEHKFFFDKDIHGFRFDIDQGKWKTGAEDETSGSFGPIVYLDQPQLVEFGDLIGVDPNSPTPNQIRYMGKKGDQYLFHPQKPIGAGVIGTIPYLLANTGQRGIKAQSVFNYDRRWSTSVFRDFLCLELPLITEDDAKPFVRKKSSIGFMNKAKCMRCHVTMDYMAATLRNLERYNTGDDDGDFTIRAIYSHPITYSKRFINELPDKYHHLYETAPDGKVFFRDIKGNLINSSVASLEEVGLAISKTDAPYYCAVQRHFKFLTGIDIPMSEVSKSFKSKNESSEITFIKNIAEKFKKSGSLKQLMADIIKSEYF